LKCKCPKWPCMSHLDIYSIGYGRKKGRESNWQFDSRPLKVRNRPDFRVCKWSVTHCWKAFKESYKFASNLVPIGSQSKKLWTPKVPRVQTRTVSGLHSGSPKEKVPFECKCSGEMQKILYGGKWWLPPSLVSQVSQGLPMTCPSTKGAPECKLTNLLVGLMQVWVSE
jgi:hypothetical protein